MEPPIEIQRKNLTRTGAGIAGQTGDEQNE
jgi:hypothetical protein